MRHCMREKTTAFIYLNAQKLDEINQIATPMQRLIAEIRSAGISIQTFTSPMDLDDRVTADLTHAIKTRLDHGGQQRDRSDQRAFAAFLEAGGFDRPRELRRLQRACWFRKRLVLVGPPGSGKSALLQALYRAKAPAARLSALTPAADRWPAIVQDIAKQCHRNSTALEGYVDLLDAIVETEPGTTIIDGLTSASEVARGDGLEWIPTARPRGTLIVSTSSSTAAAKLERQGFHRFSLRVVSPAEIRAILETRLGRFGKALDPRQLRRIEKHKPESIIFFIYR